MNDQILMPAVFIAIAIGQFIFLRSIWLKDGKVFYNKPMYIIVALTMGLLVFLSIIYHTLK